MDLMRALNRTEAHSHCQSAVRLPEAMSICGGAAASVGGGSGEFKVVVGQREAQATVRRR